VNADDIMFTNILRNLSGGRLGAPPPSPFRKMGGGLLLPILAYFGWKYRDQIKTFVQDKLQSQRSLSATGSPSNGAV
jgi:hypothetical protein